MGSSPLRQPTLPTRKVPGRTLSDEGKQPMLCFVPLSGARRHITDRDLDARFVGQPLQFTLPQVQTRAVAAATGGIDQHLLASG